MAASSASRGARSGASSVVRPKEPCPPPNRRRARQPTVLQPANRGHQAIAALGNRLDDVRLPRVVLEDAPQFADASGERVVGDEGSRPDRREDRLLRDDVPLVLGKEHQDFDSLRGHVVGAPSRTTAFSFGWTAHSPSSKSPFIEALGETVGDRCRILAPIIRRIGNRSGKHRRSGVVTSAVGRDAPTAARVYSELATGRAAPTHPVVDSFPGPSPDLAVPACAERPASIVEEGV